MGIKSWDIFVRPLTANLNFKVCYKLLAVRNGPAAPKNGLRRQKNADGKRLFFWEKRAAPGIFGNFSEKMETIYDLKGRSGK